MKRSKTLIAFQGARGAFSEEAARKLLGPDGVDRVLDLLGPADEKVRRWEGK